ncbi:crotonyl-CoA carboxylase/reductase [Arenicellales bacterium IMCC56312]
MNTQGYGTTKEHLRSVIRTPIDQRQPSKGIIPVRLEVPELQADEVLVEVRASAINYNSVWSALGHPLTPFQLINGHVRRNSSAGDHNLDVAIFGSDASGVIVETGVGVTRWKHGDEVTIHCSVVDPLDPITQSDAMLSKTQSIWGYETNFGAFAEYAKVKASQLLPKPSHVSWEVAASFGLTLSTAYRMLISPNGAHIRPGEVCLIWGAAGGLGTFAIQLCKIAGARAVAVVSDKKKEEVCKELGADLVINRAEFDAEAQDEVQGHLLTARAIKKLASSRGIPKIDVVFEHVGAATLMTSLALVERGGRIAICGASSGYESTLDLRYLWMDLKKIIGCHFANYLEAAEAAKLIESGAIAPYISSVRPLCEIGSLLDHVYAGESVGKIVLNH